MAQIEKFFPPGFGWAAVSRLEAGKTEIVLADHAAVDAVDRKYVQDRTMLSFLISPQNNPSSARFLTEGRTDRFTPLGTIVMVPSGMPIHVRADGVPARRMLYCALPESDEFPLLAESIQPQDCLDLREASVRTALMRLAHELLEPGFASAPIVEGLGMYLAGELADLLMRRKPTLRSGGLPRWQLKRIDDYLHAGNWNCRISELAAICGISSRHLMRAFGQATGRSLAEYIASIRADRARALLMDEAMSIAEIAQALRFSGASGFTTAFKRQTGLTPSAYRQLQRSGKSEWEAEPILN